MKPQSSLIATLGGQPQIITFTLDLLLARGETFDQVVVIYLPSNLRYIGSYQKLTKEFIGGQYQKHPIRLLNIPINLQGDPLNDILKPADVEATHKTIYELIRKLKSEGHHIHMSLSGGRRLLALIALGAAMQYLSPTDRIWHIYTPPDITEQVQDGRVMHVPFDCGVQLIPVPFVPWAAYFPGLSSILGRTPVEQRASGSVWLEDEDYQRCRDVWNNLTPRQQDVLRALSQGLSRKEVARDLIISVSTVDSHRAVIAHQCQNGWRLDSTSQVDAQFFVLLFGPYIRSIDD